MKRVCGKHGSSLRWSGDRAWCVKRGHWIHRFVVVDAAGKLVALVPVDNGTGMRDFGRSVLWRGRFFEGRG